MSERRNLVLNGAVITARAMLSGGQSAFGAGCGNCGVFNDIMTECGRFLLRNLVIATRAVFAL